MRETTDDLATKRSHYVVVANGMRERRFATKGRAMAHASAVGRPGRMARVFFMEAGKRGGTFVGSAGEWMAAAERSA